MKEYYVKKRPHSPMRRSILISLIFLSLGLVVLAWTFWPIATFHLFTDPVLATVVSPLARSAHLAVAQTSESDPTQLSPKDYTNPNVWFPAKPQEKVNKQMSYQLSIPKLQIEDARVVVGGEDLSKELIHYGGTALPGKNGNAAIFGHSTLPQFFNPKDYKSIFSTLPTIDIGDDIFLKFDGLTYRYKIERMTVHDPSDLSVLDQPQDDAYITLVTCVPPGTYWKRLNVRARLEHL